MRICFLANFGKTIFFQAIARSLETLGAEICWITPSRKWARFLRDEGVSEHAILDLSALSDCRPEPPAETNPFAPTPVELSEDMTLANMVLIDRALRGIQPARAIAYLALVDRACARFFEHHRPELVLGEQSWGWELVAGARARGMGIGQYCFSSARMPSERVAFWEGYREERLTPLRPVENADRIEAVRLLAAFRAQPAKPAYETTNARRPLLRPHWIAEAKDLIRGEERGNPAAMSLARRIRGRGARILNSLSCRLTPLFEPVPPAPRRPFVLSLLHVQPEASVDAYGSYHSDQIDNVVALARSLPATHDMYVKEHPSGVGCRSRNDYIRLRGTPGVRLLEPKADSFALIREAWLVVSVAGTASYEAGLLGVPAATLAPMFFQPVMAAPPVVPKALGPRALAALVARHCARPEAEKAAEAVALLAQVLASSFPALVSDPINNPECLEPENVRAIAEAVETLYHVRARSPARVLAGETAA